MVVFFLTRSWNILIPKIECMWCCNEGNFKLKYVEISSVQSKVMSLLCSVWNSKKFRLKFGLCSYFPCCNSSHGIQMLHNSHTMLTQIFHITRIKELTYSIHRRFEGWFSWWNDLRIHIYIYMISKIEFHALLGISVFLAWISSSVFLFLMRRHVVFLLHQCITRPCFATNVNMVIANQLHVGIYI